MILDLDIDFGEAILSGLVNVSVTGIDGDEQADRKHHGGPEMARFLLGQKYKNERPALLALSMEEVTMKRFVIISVMLTAAFSTQALACGLTGEEVASKGDGCEEACGSASVSRQVCEQPDPGDATFTVATLSESCDQDNPGDKGDAPFYFFEHEGVCDQGDPGDWDDGEAKFSFLDELYGVCYPGDLDEQTTAGG